MNDSRANFAAFVAKSRRRFAINRSSSPAADWSALEWRLKVTGTIANGEMHRVTFCVDHRRGATPFEGEFADFARAVILAFDTNHLIKRTGSAYRTLIAALRSIYRIIDPSSFNVTILDGDTLTKAYQQYSLDVAPGTAENIGVKIAWIASLLDDHGITQIGQWIHGKRKLNKAPSEDDLLNEDQIEGLAYLANVPNLSDNDRLLLCVVWLILIGGFRLGEVLTLPRDAWCEQEQFDDFGQPLLDASGRAVVHCGLRFWAGKTGGLPMIKPLPSELASTAQELVDEALRLTESAWQVAAHQALYGGTTLGAPWDDLADEALMSPTDIAQALGLRSERDSAEERGKAWIRKRSVPHTITKVRVGDVESVVWTVRKDAVCRMLLAKSFLGNCRPDRRSTDVTLSHLLFIKYARGIRGTATLIIEQNVQDFLCGTRSKSVFERLDIRVNGKIVAITPKQFRSSMNAAAIRSDLNEVIISRLFGRKVVAVNDKYNRLGQNERMESLQSSLQSGGETPMLDLPVPEPYPQSERLVRSGQGAHVTPIGICHHPYADTPCEAHAGFVARGFRDRDLDGISDEDALELLVITQDQLDSARGEADVHGKQAWIKSYETELDALRTRLGRTA